MSVPIILATSSEIRATLMRNAGVDFEVVPGRIDEDAIKDAMLAEGRSARDIADALAEQKARKVSSKRPEAMVLGFDQTLDQNGQLLSKPANPEDGLRHLQMMRGQTHQLYSACVIYQNAEPIWRHVGRVNLRMRDLSDDYIQAYLDRNWDGVRYSVGCYNLEEEGIRLFTKVDGDYFTVLGVPLLEILNYLTLRGVLET
ncbi:MAG: nucleoside triphosphate pyrophosphatase [Paracoccaceae bacterium]